MNRSSDQPRGRRTVVRSRAVRHGFILLEVVVAVALLVIGLTFIGSQIGQSQESSFESEALTRRIMLAESKLAELDTGLVNLDAEADNEVEGDFSLLFPDYGWRMRFDETTTENLRLVTLHILYAPRETLEDDFDLKNAKIVYTVYALRAVPPVVDLQVDFGVDDDALQKLSEEMPIDDFDPANFNPAIFQTLEFDQLVTVLPALMQAFGISLDELNAMIPPELRDMLDLAGQEPEDDSAQPADDSQTNRRPGDAGQRRPGDNQTPTSPAAPTDPTGRDTNPDEGVRP